MLALRLERYTLVEEIHRGDHSAIYRGRRDADGQPILAELLTDEYPSPTQLARLRHAHRIAHELDLAGAPRATRLEPYGHGLALIWADPGGVPLRRLIAAGPLPRARALALAAAIAGTLAAVHERRIVHKDLNPANILVDPSTGAAQLIGFGRAAHLARDPAQRAGPTPLDGDLTYVSPEQTGRMNRVVDRRSDLYSLGVVLYELLTGAPPFVSADAIELVHSHLVRAPAPAHERVADLPPLLSALLAKLLAKSAEDRYQHARALAEDLRECVARLEAGAALEPFELAASDHERGDELDIPQRLYGREAELDALLAAWRRVAAGAVELLLVRGYSGIGKSVLVHEIHRELSGTRGYFVSGKFDQLGRAVPYAALRAALAELVDLLLTEPEHELARIRERLLAALGDDVGVVTELLGEFERVVGRQPPPARLAATASRRRFMRAIQRLIAACTDAERPLVVFLDDLQWADLASLELLAALVRSEAGHPLYLLIIGAYRSNEVDADHPLTACLRELEPDARPTAIELGPLARADVLRLVADTLAMPVDEVAPLARIVHAKTGGNPFFLIQLLLALQRDGALRYDASARAYTWDEPRVHAMAASDNVVEFMTERIGRLPAATGRALELAACVGHRFELGALAVIAERPPQALIAELWPALEHGVIVALDPEYRLTLAADGESVAFRFVHDRVQQAAYGRIAPEDRAAWHLRIGRLLRARGSERAQQPDGDEVFELVAQLNLGRALIEDADERCELARLNLAAGRRARAATAYAAATDYFSVGVELLDRDATGEGDGFARDYELAFELLRGAAEAAIAGGEHDRAEPGIERLARRARTPLERAEVLDLRVVSSAARGRPSAAVEAGLDGLALLGYAAPEPGPARRHEYERELAEIIALLAARPLDELAADPRGAPPTQRLAMQLAGHTALSAFGVETNLGYWLTALAARLSLVHGLCDQSASAYALLGAVVASTTTRFAEAHRLVTLALAVHERRGDGVHEACMLGFYFITVSHYAVHWRTLLPDIERARLAGVESGDALFHSYACSHWVIARSILGDPLDEVRADVERMRATMQRQQLASAVATQTVVRQTIACLEGRSFGPTSLSDERCDERELLATITGANMSFALYWYRTSKGMLAYLTGDHAAALAELEPVAAMVPIAFTPEARYFTALALLGLDGELDRDRAALLARCRAELQTWAEACPANYRHRYLLVEAEAARRADEFERATQRYDDALDAATEFDWPRDLALINERAASFYLGRGRTRIARAYMTDAAYAYVRWGAHAQVRRLAERFPGLVPVEAQLAHARATELDQREFGDDVDMLAFARSLQTISREVLLDTVVERIMQIVIKSAGAQRGALVLEQDGALLVCARVTADQPGVALTRDEPLDGCDDLATSVVRYAARRNESVVIDDAGVDGRFAADPYIARVRPRSIACLAMSQQGRGRGVLYLENNASTAAFTRRRLELLELLGSQAVISLDNARLFDALREREAAWRALVSSAPDLIVILDREHRIATINKPAHGLEADRVIGARIEELMTPETRARLRESIERVFAGGDQASCDSAMAGPDGLIQLTCRIGPIVDAGVIDRVTLICTDVTEQRELENDLRQSQKMQAVGTLAGGVAHDFNNLLTVIVGAAELCELVLDDRAAAAAAVREIIEAADRASALIRDLLAFSRKQRLEPRRVDLDELVANMGKMLTRLLGERLTLALERAGRPCPVIVDPNQMEQVVMNLAVNARDAMPEGGTLTFAIDYGDPVVLRVSDTGDGMDEGVRQRIFDPFFTTKPVGKGTGLGLATVLGVIEQSEGRISVTSEPGRGTCFRIELPLAAEPR